MKKILFIAIILIIIITAMITESGLRFLTVTGNSMNPEITQDDIVIVVPVDTKLLVIGDIVTYKLDMGGKEYLFTHRIIDIDNGVIKTKGDNMKESDMYSIMPKDVVGRVLVEIPYIGLLIRSVHTTIGYLVLIFIPSILIIIREIKKIIHKN